MKIVLVLMLLIGMQKIAHAQPAGEAKRCFELEELYADSKMELPNGDAVFTKPRILSDDVPRSFQYIDGASDLDAVCVYLFNYKRSVQSWSDYGIGPVKVLIEETGDFRFLSYPTVNHSNLSPIISKIVCTQRE